MFRHQGRSRTLKHNLQIATILSFVAGLVNVTGFLAFQKLTTNVTGHFALFIYDLANFDFWRGTVYFLYIFFFLFGSFLSGFLIELFRENKRLNVFVIPTLIESLILTWVVLYELLFENTSPDVLVCALLLAMGLQNSFVTKISKAVVRTTHLTGLFTDLGIELSQLFFPKAHQNRDTIITTIKLRVSIILFFFLGGLIGGFIYSELNLELNTLLIGVAVLIFGLIYDDLRYQLLLAHRKRKHRKFHGKAIAS